MDGRMRTRRWACAAARDAQRDSSERRLLLHAVPIFCHAPNERPQMPRSQRNSALRLPKAQWPRGLRGARRTRCFMR
eukprot:1404438-Pleurochrysis_carterae.AAC.6